MAKRRASSVASDPEASDVGEETSSKRARLNDDTAVGEEETDEQKDFEARFGDKVRASIEAKTKGQGRIAELGIIQSLEMHQFMCHPRLSFIFGPQINFIIGHNGSGKSAVLSAITIALGGKAITTGRGSGLKSFIREGQSWSEVTVTIKNEGDDAYRPEVYGKSIVITRRFTKEGSSSYKIKSKDGRTVSIKREELSAICDHMNIHVDNPMNVLSQDSARQFLSASHPSEKYEFFLKGTQLKQLSEEYETCLENIGRTYKMLEAKKDVLPDLRKAVADATTRYKGARKAMETKAKVGELKQEQAWSYVQEKEDDMKAKIGEVAKLSRKIPKLQDHVSEANDKFEEINQTIVRLENERAELGDINHLVKQRSELLDKLRANKTRIQECITDINVMNNELKGINNTITQCETQIAVETEKLNEDKQAEREERQRKLNAAKKDVDDHESQLSQVNDQIRKFKEEKDSLKNDIVEAESTKANAEREMRSCRDQLDQMARQEHDRISKFGPRMPEVIRKIDATKWYGEKPVGPLGLYVSCRDQRWASVMRATLANLMMTFAVTDARDRNTLRQLLVSSGSDNMQVIVSERDLFDYSRGEPPENVLTVLRALEFTDEYVKRIFINQHRIEKTVLAPSRREGERLADQLVGGGTAFTADMMRVQAYGDGGYYSQPLYELRAGDAGMWLFGHQDPEKERQQWEERGRQADAKYQEASRKLGDFSRRLAGLNSELSRLDNAARVLSKKVYEFKRHHQVLQNETNDDVSVSISALEDAKNEAEATKTDLLAQFERVQELKKQIDSEQRPLLQELNEVKKKCDDFDEKKSLVDAELFTATDERTGAEHKQRHWITKLAEEQKRVQELEEATQELQVEYENWTKSAEDFCGGKRIENPRKNAEIMRQLKSVEKALEDQQRENGATIEELELALVEAKQKYKNTEKELRDMTNLNKVLKQSVVFRLNRWHDFRRHIALRTKLQFQYHLANRAYFGKVLFDHDKQRLELKVQTDDQAATQGMNKDPKSLSGGEKSFSTICLLLALWEAIGCPIRCLDEFDVFMDAVNRRISMKMMIDTANASDSKQYVLITPQDMSNVAFGPSVRVHRMGDPERGQNTLAF